jgi:Flp pilus assembly pilin Flp
MLRKLLRDESGSPGLEYALILGLVGTAIFLAMRNLAGGTEALMEELTTEIAGMTAEIGQ